MHYAALYWTIKQMAALKNTINLSQMPSFSIYSVQCFIYWIDILLLFTFNAAIKSTIIYPNLFHITDFVCHLRF